MARYDYGVERRVYLPNVNEHEIDNIVRELVEQAREINAAIPNRFWEISLKIWYGKWSIYLDD